MLKTYRYKLEPNKAQRYALARTLDVCRELYNMGLEHRKMHRVSKFEQSKELPDLKDGFPIYHNVYGQVLQNALGRLDKAFQNFFRRCKEGGKPGFPRFKSENRYDSFTYPQLGFKLAGSHLQLGKIGNIKVRLSRELPDGAKIKTCTIKRTVSGWFAFLVFEYEPTPLPSSDLEIGIDVGIENFAALDDGSFIPNPRFYQAALAELRRAQRRVSRRKKGSSRRRKAIVLLRKVHERIRNQRLDFLHKVSTELVQKYGLIGVEALNIQGMAKGNLSKFILDCSWSTFFNFISYKAAEAGRIFRAVNARFTSQECPHCGHIKKKELSEREHHCEECGYHTHRDTAAAQVILQRARIEPSDDNVGRLSPCVV